MRDRMMVLVLILTQSATALVAANQVLANAVSAALAAGTTFRTAGTALQTASTTKQAVNNTWNTTRATWRAALAAGGSSTYMVGVAWQPDIDTMLGGFLTWMAGTNNWDIAVQTYGAAANVYSSALDTYHTANSTYATALLSFNQQSQLLNLIAALPPQEG